MLNKRLMAWIALPVAAMSTLRPVHGQTPGTVRWELDFGVPISSSPALGADGTIYLTTEQYGRIHALHAVHPNGTLNWTLSTNTPFSSSPPFSSPTIGDDGTIYVSWSYRVLLAANPDGRWKWLNLTNGSATSPVAIANAGDIIVGATDLHSLNLDGSRRWSLQAFNGDDEPPSIARDGTIIYGSYHANIYAVSPNGAMLWRQFNGNLYNFSPSLGQDGTIYGCSGNNLYSLSPQGASNWVFRTSDMLRGSSAIGPDGTIYLGSQEGLYALRTNGTVIWRYPATNAPSLDIESCPAVAADGTIYFTDTVTGFVGNTLYAVGANGSLIWSHPTTNTAHSSFLWITKPSPVIAEDGTVYFCAGNQLIALRGSAPLANSPWPMYRRDVRHTSRAGGSATRRPSVAIASAPGQITLNAVCEWGRSFRVETTSDLAQWTSVTNFTGSMQPHVFTWPLQAGSPSGFYRIVSP